MTISNASRTAGPFIGDGVTKTYPFSYKVFNRADVLVARTVTATGAETILVLDADYTVTLNANQNAVPGGVIVLSTALAVGTTLAATSNLPIQQSLDLTNNGGFYPAVINDAFDRVVILIQQLAARVGAGALNIGLAATIATVLNALTNLASSAGAAMIGLAQGGTVQDAIKFVTPEMFTGATDLIRLNAAAAYADANNVEMRLNDHATHYDLDGGTFLLPRRFSGYVRAGSDGRGHLLQNGTTILRTKATPDVQGVDATVFRCEGLQKGRVHKLRLDTWVLDGFSTSWGIFWTDFADVSTGITTLDVSRFAINSNTFRNVVSGISTGYGIDITDGTNAGSTFYECHGNVFIACDVAHSRGYMNRSNLNQANTILGGYAEDISAGYKAVSGNWNIDGMNSDSGGIPPVGLYNHIFGMTTQSERTGGDVLSMAEKSIVSLDWSVRDSSGKPPAISGAGGVVADATMPGGSRARFGAVTASAFANVTVTIPAFYSYGAYPRFVLTGYWYGDLPASIEVDNGDGSVAAYSTEGFVALGGNYYLFRITGYGSITSSTTVRFFITTSAVSRTGYIGACHASPYKAAPLPYRPAASAGGSVTSADVGGMVLQRGVANQSYTSASPTTLPITFPTPFAAAPTVTLAAIPAATYAGKLTGCEIVPGSITVNGFSVRLAFAPDWTGDINWLAIG